MEAATSTTARDGQVTTGERQPSAPVAARPRGGFLDERLLGVASR
jgi:hypothetical protein